MVYLQPFCGQILSPVKC